ncbi:peroxiredoxin family protein [Crateriforma conspicua]|uniref:Thiol-disulfide oxidoreductase n=1 Tax=Crateriforma conspicua TaxID=2527996 RepID=A0A5C6FVM5_9PLAN|nr:TlpA disulfide reductase family protein [Crateriforma conspicua]TWU67057.1 thiol-disulfide oxidoreductase [Crateriforma conspicua]
MLLPVLPRVAPAIAFAACCVLTPGVSNAQIHLWSHPLLGIKPPPCQIELSDGSQITLPQFRSDNAVLLYFWNTSSELGLMGLPKIDAIAQRFSDRRIRFLAVNTGDDLDEANRSYEEFRLSIPTAVDPSGDLRRLLSVPFLPSILMIDKGGIVQVADYGLHRDLNSTLGGKIEAVLAGQSLAAESLRRIRDESTRIYVLPPGDDAYTVRKLSEDKYQYHHRTLVDSYKKLGKRNARWDTDAIAFLDETAKSFASKVDRKTDEALESIGKTLMDRDCDDPVVRYAYAVMLYRNNRDKHARPKAITIIEQSHGDFSVLGYPTHLKLAAARMLWNFYRDQDNKKQYNAKKAKRYLDRCWHQSLEAIPIDDPESHQSRVIAENVLGFFSELPPGLRGNYFFTANKMKDLSPWLVNLIGGQMHLDKAWQARGNGWASEVTPEGWKGFEDHLQRAENCLRRAWKACPERPHAATEMITVAMAGGTDADEGVDFWFRQATEAQFDYWPAYAKWLHAMRPRWGGSHNEMLEFGQQCAATGRCDGDVPYTLCDAVIRIMRDRHNPVGERYIQKPGVYQAVRNVCNQYLDEAQNNETLQDWQRSNMKHWWRSMWLAFAYHAGQYQEARRLLELIEFKPHDDPFGKFPLDADQVIFAVMSRTGPRKNQIAEAVAAIQSKQYSAAVEKLEAVLQNDDLYPLVADRLESLQVALTWRVALDQSDHGTEISLLPSDDRVLGWEKVSGEWIRRPSGAIRGISQTTGMIARCQVDFGPRWELSGEIVHGSSPYAAWDAGIFLYDSNEVTHAVLFNPTERWVAVGPMDDLDDHQKPFKPKNNEVPFVIRMNDGVVNVWLDYRRVVKDKQLEEWNPAESHFIAIGAKYHYADAVLNFRDLRIRSWKPFDAQE